MNVGFDLLQQAMREGWTDRRRDILLMRKILDSLITQALDLSFDPFEILKIEGGEEWKLLGFPHWISRGTLSDYEREQNKKKSRFIPPLREAELWHREFCSQLRTIIKYHKVYDPDEFEDKFFLDARALPEYRKALAKLKKLWSGRSRDCRPPNEISARLPEIWQNGVIY